MGNFIRLAAVKRKTGLSKSSIYQMMNLGNFPTSISIGTRAVAWDEEEIDEWAHIKVAESRNKK